MCSNYLLEFMHLADIPLTTRDFTGDGLNLGIRFCKRKETARSAEKDISVKKTRYTEIEVGCRVRFPVSPITKY